MGFFTRKKKLAFEKTYPALIDLAVYINNLKKTLDDPTFITNLTDTDLSNYIDTLYRNKHSNFTKIRGIETIDTLNNALVELAINIQAFQKELSQLPDVVELAGDSKIPKGDDE
jgi:hypothetical protein